MTVDLYFFNFCFKLYFPAHYHLVYAIIYAMVCLWFVYGLFMICLWFEENPKVAAVFKKRSVTVRLHLSC